MNSPQLSTIIKAIILSLLLTMTACSSKKKAADGLNGDGISESDLDYQRDNRFGEGAIPTAEGEGMFKDVHFGYDSSALDSEAKQDLEFNVQVLSKYPTLKVTLEGHCDERGTNEYNMALGAQRAQSVYDLLKSYGVDRSRIETISYGEEVPLDPSGGESAWTKNRRVHFSAHSSVETTPATSNTTRSTY